MSEDQSSNGSGSKTWMGRISKVFSSDPQDREELKELISDSCGKGILDAEAVAMIVGALAVSEMQVRDAMVPRSHMIVIPLETSLEELLSTVLDSGHSRFPVIGEDRDEVEGILLAKDLLRHYAEDSGPFKLKSLLRPAVVIPESKRLNMLLRDFRASRNHMAIVVDEYGGVSGLLTIEDVLEEIVGEIDDEHDPQVAEPIQQQGNHWNVMALTRIDEFNEFFSTSLDDDDYETIGGLIMREFGRLPRRGEEANFGGFLFRVTQADRRRIHRLDVFREAEPESIE
jgi:magnesium and cobalt transporter